MKWKEDKLCHSDHWILGCYGRKKYQPFESRCRCMFHFSKMNKARSALIRFDHSYIQSHQLHRSHLAVFFTAEVLGWSAICDVCSPSPLDEQH